MDCEAKIGSRARTVAKRTRSLRIALRATIAIVDTAHLHQIPPHIRAAIMDELAQIEREHEVTILWAIESGSRAWGFPSPDSDFDARFIYVHRPEWYLSIVPGRDVIERPVDEVFDVSGWDLRKALGLLRGGNATLAEWFNSLIRYREYPGFRDEFMALVDAAHRPDRAYWHYRSVSERHSALAQAGGSVKLKRWLYALRTCLAAEWAAEFRETPPMRLVDLTDGLVTDAELRARIDAVVAAKAGLAERSDVAVDPVLVEWLKGRIGRLASIEVDPVEPADVAMFDEFFRRWIAKERL